MKLFLGSVILAISSLSFAQSPDTLAQAFAREQAQLISIRDSIRTQIQSLRDRQAKDMASLEAEILKLEKSREVAVLRQDELKARWDEMEKKNKSQLGSQGIEGLVRELQLAIDKAEGSVSAGPVSRDPLRGLEMQTDRALKLLGRASEIHTESGAFTDKSGVLRQGQLVKLGEAAIYSMIGEEAWSLGPDGKGGWLEIMALPADTLKGLMNGDFKGSMIPAYLTQSLKVRADGAVGARLADKAAGYIPLVWLSLLGLAVTGLFIVIARA